MRTEQPRLPLSQVQKSGLPVNYKADAVTTNTITYEVIEVIELRSFMATYVSDANAGNRNIAMTITGHDGIVVYQDYPTINQAQNLTHYYTWAIGAQTGTAIAGLNLLRGLPPITLYPGATIQVFDNADIAGTDDITAFSLHTWTLTVRAVQEGYTDTGVYDKALGIRTVDKVFTYA